MKKLSVFIILLLLVLVPTAFGLRDFYDDMTGRGLYGVQNLTHVNSSLLCVGSPYVCIGDWDSVNGSSSSGGSDGFWNITSSIYLYNNSDILDVNETKLNATIDARDSDTTYTADDIYLYLSTTTFTFNETKLNNTIDARDTDTTYTAGNYLYLSSTQFNVNETDLNATIDARENDTTYTAGQGLTLTSTEFNHTDTSTQTTVTNSYMSFIKNVQLDTFGHITALTSGTIDQALNTSSDVIFASVGSVDWTNVSITESQISDHTVYSADEVYINLDGSQFNQNEAKLNSTIDARDADTTYSAGNGISLSSTTFSVAGNTALTQDGDGLSVTADAIGDTQLAYNTGQHLTSTSAVTFLTVNTGQGANELYGMDQDVLTTSDPTFADVTATTFIGNINRSYVVNNWDFCPAGSAQYGENETGRYCDATFLNSTDTAADSTAWITMTSLQAKWFADTANVLTFDEAELNTTIDARDSDTTYTALAPLGLSGTEFNLTICSDDEILKMSGTSWGCEADASGGGGSGSWDISTSNYLYNHSNILDINETHLNATIDARADGEGVTSVTGTSPIVSSGGTTPAISLTLLGDLATTAPITGAVANIFPGADGNKATIAISVLKDLVTTAPLTGGADNILTGTDSDITLAITLLKDVVVSGTGLSGGADNVLPGVDSDVTITLTTNKDIVTTAPLTGGEDNILPGADADLTIAMPVATTSANGYLSSTDWNTFNNKGSGDVSKVDTPVNNQVGVWTGDGTIEGTTSFTWDDTTQTVTNAGGEIADFHNSAPSTDITMRYGYTDYGWIWKYEGSGAGNDNKHIFYSEGAGGDDVQVYEVTQDGEFTFSQAVNVPTLNTGNGDYELYAMNQDVESTDAVTFLSVDTGEGANELFNMNQDVESTDAVTFITIDTGNGATEVYDMNQDVQSDDAVTFLTLDTGYGANELWDMDQHVLTTSDVAFVDVTATNFNMSVDSANHRMYDNATCVIITGTSATLEIC